MALTGSYSDDFGNTNTNAYAVIDDCIANKKSMYVSIKVKIFKDKSAREAGDRELYLEKFGFLGEKAEAYFDADTCGETKLCDIYVGAYTLAKTLTDVPFEGWEDVLE